MEFSPHVSNLEALALGVASVAIVVAARFGWKALTKQFGNLSKLT